MSDHLLFYVFSMATNRVRGTGLASINYIGQSDFIAMWGQSSVWTKCQEPSSGSKGGYQGGVRLRAQRFEDADASIQKYYKPSLSSISTH